MTVYLCVRLVLFSNCSFRSAASVMRELSATYKVEKPSHTTIQNWILKYGVAHLADGVKRRDDWIFILDHTVEFGTKKCLLVLGVPRSHLRKNRCSIKHKDAIVLAIHLSDTTSSAGVKDVLGKIAEKVGKPVQIVSDHGSDIKKGVEDYIKSMQKPIVYTYDITHKTGTILKSALKNDAAWESFVRKCVDTKRLVLQTDMGHLAPLKPSDKARWLNLDDYVKWADAIRSYAMEMKFESACTPTAVRYQKFFGWLEEYSTELTRWSLMVKTLQAAKTEVKMNGLHHGTAERFMERAKRIRGAMAGVPEIVEELRLFLVGEGAALPDDGKWLGSSDVIESVFGKYKSFSQRRTMKGVGKTVLTIPAFTGKMSSKRLKMALEKTTCGDVREWKVSNIGDSLSAKRKKALGKTRKTENPVKFSGDISQKAANF
jgi:hypothetical protein